MPPVTFESPQSLSGTEQGSRWWSGGCGLLVVIGAVAGFAYLGRSSFWLDETVSTTLADASWHRFTHVVTTREANMTLYYLLLRVWIHVGHSEATVRTLSVLASLGALILIILLTRRLFDRRAALVCGLLFAIDPLIVEYAQDARGYTLSVLLVTASSLLFVRGIRAPSARFTWTSYVLISALAGYVNFWAALVPLGHAVSLAFLPDDKIPWRRYLPAVGGLVVLFVPLGLLIHSTDNAGTNWAAGTAAGRLFGDVRNHVPLPVLDVFALGVLAAAAGIVLLLRRRAIWIRILEHWPLVFTVCLLVVPVAALVLLSLVYKPLFVLHYLLVYFPPAIILVAVGLTRLTPRAALITLVVLVTASGAGLWRWYATGPGEDWRGAVTYVSDQSHPSDGVMIFAPYMRIPFEWYLQQHPEAERHLHAVYPSLAWGVDPLRFDYPIPISSAAVERGAHGYTRVWLVLSDAQLYPEQKQAVKHGLQLAGFVAKGSRVFSGVEVVRYVFIQPSTLTSLQGTRSRPDDPMRVPDVVDQAVLMDNR